MRLTLGRKEWLSLSVTLLIALPLIISIALHDHIYTAYLHHVVAPELEHHFQFKSGTERITDNGQALDVFLIDSVQSSGIFGKAGFQSGDIPVGYKHGFESGFYQDLLSAKKGYPTEITVVRVADVRRGKWQRRKIKLHLQK